MWLCSLPSGFLLILLWAYTVGSVSVFIFETQPNNSSHAVGSELTIWCGTNYQNRAGPTPSWLQMIRADGNKSLAKKNSTELHKTNYHDRYGVTYYIRELARRDAGKYVCRGVILEEEYRSTLNIKVTWPPSGASIYNDEVQHTTKIGGALALKCSITDRGSPISNILWFREGKPSITIQNTTSQWLVINNLTSVRQAGPYFCQAINSHGESERSNGITVPIIAPLRLEARSPENKTLRPMYNIAQPILTLTVSGNPAGEAMLYKFFQDLNGAVIEHVMLNAIRQTTVTGKFMYGQEEATEYNIKLDMPEEATCDNVGYFNGEYRFVVKMRDPGTWDNNVDIRFTVEFQYPPLWRAQTPHTLTTDLGSRNISISCEVCSNPTGTFTWMLSGQRLLDDIIVSAESGSRIIIPEVNVRHLGTYQCGVAYIIDDSEHTQTFDIVLQKSVGAARAAVGPWVIGIFIIMVLLILCLITVWWYRRKRNKEKNIAAGTVTVELAVLDHSISRLDATDKDTGEVNVELVATVDPVKENTENEVYSDVYDDSIKKGQGIQKEVMDDTEYSVVYDDRTKKEHAAKKEVTDDREYSVVYDNRTKKEHAAKKPAHMVVGDNKELYTQPMKKEPQPKKPPKVSGEPSSDMYAEPMKKGKKIKRPILAVAVNTDQCTHPKKDAIVSKEHPKLRKVSLPVQNTRPSGPPPPPPMQCT